MVERMPAHTKTYLIQYCKRVFFLFSNWREPETGLGMSGIDSKPARGGGKGGGERGAGVELR